MSKIDEALVERLGTYLDGEATPEEATAIEELMAKNADVRRTAEELKAASQAVSDLFLSHVEDKPVPSQWRQLIESNRPVRGKAWPRWMPSWPVAASVALLCASVILSAVSYITLQGARDIQAKIARSSEQSVTGVAELSQSLIRKLGQSNAVAADRAQTGNTVSGPLDDGVPGQGSNQQHRLAMAMAQLREANDLADTSREVLSKAHEQIRSLQAQLAQATDPIAQMAAYHRLLVDTEPSAGVAASTPPSRAALAARLRAQLGERLPVPDLAAYDLAFSNGDLLLLNRRPAAQLRYLDPGGEWLSLWIMRASQEHDDRYRTARWRSRGDRLERR